jgi:hypothetical protein
VVSGGSQYAYLYGWFWHPKKYVKTAAELIDYYYTSVGRNGNMLLNLSPDTRGLIPDNQLAHLRLMTQVVNETFARNLAAGGKLTADNSNRANNPSLTLDGDLDSWWEAAPGKTTATLTLTLPKAISFDVVSLQEAVFEDDGEPITLMDQVSLESGEAGWFAGVSVRRALAELPERDRKILYLRFFQEKTQTEVAQMLGVSQVQISRLEKSALFKIREHLGDE